MPTCTDLRFPEPDRRLGDGAVAWVLVTSAWTDPESNTERLRVEH